METAWLNVEVMTLPLFQLNIERALHVVKLQLVSCWKSTHVPRTPRYAVQHINMVDINKEEREKACGEQSTIDKTW